MGWGFESLLLRHSWYKIDFSRISVEFDFQSMKLTVGLTSSDLKRLSHGSLRFRSSSLAKLYQVALPGAAQTRLGALVDSFSRKELASAPAGATISIGCAAGGDFAVSVGDRKFSIPAGNVLLVDPLNGTLSSLSFTRAGARGKGSPSYRGAIAVYSGTDAVGGLRAAVILDIDDYLRGVLQSEIPASYHIEAIKAQAVAARTYALNPRVDHGPDRVNVCDSYLCCQYFGGLNTSLASSHKTAIDATSHQILTYDGAPILALFSSNAGGHTENYENCFSDIRTNQFPPPAVPYLRGVSEAFHPTSQIAGQTGAEKYLRALYASGTPRTADAWSHHFKWQVSISAAQLEAHLHNTAAKMLAAAETAPFIVPPKSAKFGHILDVAVDKRGVSGSAVEISVKTKSGDWKVRKELVIRDFFVIPNSSIKRLKSARFYLDIARNSAGLISNISFKGLGWGHGVGLQQTGAQGWAKSGRDYRQILAHYYQGTNIERA
ncbi:SpoIID/LytB domain-containing protein [bacterium]|nr:SpoIID/LytB domain-containing protein [bacterium]